MLKIKLSLRRLWQNPEYTMPLILIIWGALYIIFGAVINRNNGLGFDGASYGSIIKDFYNLLLNDKLSSYQIQRIFPLFLSDSILTIFRLPKEDFYIIKFFQFYNLILLIACTYFWNKISSMYHLDLKYKWLGFVLGFVNFGIAKMTFYYPVLTDTTAFFMGFALLYFHLKNNLTWKIIITFIGAFTWPSFMYIGLLMIIFPNNSKFEFSLSSEPGKRSLNVYIAVLVPLIFFITAIYNVREYFSGKLFVNITTPVFASMLYIDAVLNLLLMTFLFYALLPENITFSGMYFFIKKVLTGLKVKNILSAVFIFAAVYIIQKNLSDPGIETGSSFSQLIYTISIYSISKPFVYYVTAVTYFGPCFIILFFFLKKYRIYLSDLGIGVYLSFLISLTLIFTSEARLIINFLPFIIMLSVLVIKDFSLNKTTLIAVCIFSLILSKLYISLERIPADNALFSDYFLFPNQLFFMNLYSISKLSYYVQGFVILIMSVFMVIRIRKESVKA